MARYSFFTAQAYVVVDPAGHFDVYPTADRPGNDKPVYRGELSKLGAPIRDGDGRLAVRWRSPNRCQCAPINALFGRTFGYCLPVTQ
jgi:hypothetical protein